MEESTMVKEMNEIDNSDTEHVPPETHNKLLNAVYQIYKKQRINKPLRREPTSQISEFNLSHKTSGYSKKIVNVNELVRALNKRATHHEIRKKVQTLQRKSKPLPKPMEKIHADEIRRKVGYENVRKELSRWEAIVERNRAAEQLKFPLQDNTELAIKESNDFLKTFKEPTELEKEVAAVLQTSEVAQEDKEIEEKFFPLSLEEIIERRKLIAQMRARESYKMAKAYRQNKIKSKKYHRILKREKIKKALKDFEILQETNPEAALEKLERIERARAEERFTLRHRNTGKWAKSQAIRAKYDTEARAQLAEQLAKSRELTKKLKSTINSSSEDEQDNESDEENLQMDPSNPWASSNTEIHQTEITSFLEGYKKYQNEKTNVKEGNEINVDNSKLVKLDSDESNSNTQLNSKSIDVTVNEVSVDVRKDCGDTFGERQINGPEGESGEEEASNLSGSKEDSSKESCTLSSSNSLLNEDNKTTSLEAPSIQEDVLKKSAAEEHLPKKGCKDNQPDLTVDVNQQPSSKASANHSSLGNLSSSDSDVNMTTPDKRNNAFNDSVIKSKQAKNSPKSKMNISENILKVETSTSPKMKTSTKKSSGNLSSKLNKNKIDNTASSVNKKLKKKCSKVKTQSGVWAVSTSEDTDKELTTQQENIQIDKMFDKAENVLKETLDNHINQLKEGLKETDKSETHNDKKSKYQSDLSFKSSKRKLDSDSKLIEVATEGVSGGANDIKSILKVYDNDDGKSTGAPAADVVANVIAVKPSKLNSGGIEYVEQHEDTVDNEELLEEQNRLLNLEDAFADDDVAEEFRREKEEEIEKSKPKEINLSLPGWGSWAGHNIEPNENLPKRKKRRLIVKLPEIKRKDEKKDYVIINEELNPALKSHMVHDLPFPFTRVKDYETSIRAPIGSHWVPQSAFMKLIKPSVVTKLGAIIEPMKETELVKNRSSRIRKRK